MPRLIARCLAKSRQPVVFAEDEEVFTNSRDVAAFFDKRHDNAMQTIANLIASEPKLGLLNFKETPYVEPSTGQTYRSYDMDRDGFTLLAMGFTGGKALKWKLRYIGTSGATLRRCAKDWRSMRSVLSASMQSEDTFSKPIRLTIRFPTKAVDHFDMTPERCSKLRSLLLEQSVKHIKFAAIPMTAQRVCFGLKRAFSPSNDGACHDGALCPHQARKIQPLPCSWLKLGENTLNVFSSTDPKDVRVRRHADGVNRRVACTAPAAQQISRHGDINVLCN